jgi:hypothetical protein
MGCKELILRLGKADIYSTVSIEACRTIISISQISSPKWKKELQEARTQRNISACA